MKFDLALAFLCVTGGSLAVTFVGLVARALIEAFCPDLRPPIAETQVIPVEPFPDGQMIHVDRDTTFEMQGDGIAGGLAEVPIKHYTLRPAGSDHPLWILATYATADSGTNLRFVRHKWPRWWQRLLYPNVPGGDSYYVIPVAWDPEPLAP